MNVQIPVKWLQELLALCGPEDHELRERVMVSITAMDEQAARAVARPEHDEAVNEVMGLVKEVRVMAIGHGIRTGGISTTSDQSIEDSANLLRELEASIETKLRALLATGGQAQADCERCKGSGEDPEGYYDQSRGPDGDTHEGPCRTCNGTGAAPQAQADARDAEQERWMGIGKAIERACVDLPAGAEINIHLEKDAGTVTLSDCDGDEQENFPTDEGLAGVVNAAIDAAIAAAKGE